MLSAESWLLFTLFKHQDLSDYQITTGLASLASIAFTLKVTYPLLGLVSTFTCLCSLVESFVQKSLPKTSRLIKIPYVCSLAL